MKTSIAVLALIHMLSGLAAAGSLDAPGAPAAGSGMPSTAEIYNRLDSGAAIAVPGAFQEPLGGPASSGRTLADIRAKLPTPDNANGATASEVAAGKTFWGLRTDGTWGLRSGAMAAGGNVTGGNGVLTFSIPDGFYAGRIATASDSNLVAGNIRSGVTVFGVAGTASQGSGTAVAADVLAGKTFSNSGATGIAGTMPNNGALSITPGTTAQAIPAGYHNGSGSVAGDANLIAGNIRSGVTIFGVSGTLAELNPSHFASITATCAGKWTGTYCEICPAPWTGDQCDSCPTGWSGANCAVHCPVNGWSGPNCDVIVKPFPTTPPSYAATPWKCVLDSATGLTWEVKDTSGGLHDWNNSYTWYSSTHWDHGTATAGTCIGQPGCDTEKFVAATNAEQLCGYNDWRMPTAAELQSLVLTGHVPTIDTAYFPNTYPTAQYNWEKGNFWGEHLTDGAAKAVWFWDGAPYNQQKSRPNSVRLVRP